LINSLQETETKFPVHPKGTFDDFGRKFFIFQYSNSFGTGSASQNTRIARILARINEPFVDRLNAPA
jgi:hypothetical protein